MRNHLAASRNPRVALSVAGGAFAAVAVLFGVQAATAAVPSDIHLRGTTDADQFAISVTNDGRLEFCTTFCFTRSPADVDAITVMGFEGDDSLYLGHGAGIVTNYAADAPIVFDAGIGADQLVVCGDAPNTTNDSSCSSSLDSLVEPGAVAGETRLVQQHSRGTMTVTLSQVARIVDRAPGPVQVSGSAQADQLSIGSAAGLGEVRVGTSTPYQHERKDSLLLDTAGGSDRVVLGHPPGLTNSGNCAPVGAAAAPVCIRGDDTTDDRVVVAGTDGRVDAARYTPRGQGDGTLRGMTTAGSVDLLGIDALDLDVRPGADGDNLQVDGTGDEDLLEVSAVSATDSLRLTGELRRDTTFAFSLPQISATAVGSTPLPLRFDAGLGDDVVVHAGTGHDESYRLAPTTSQTCPLTQQSGTSTCVRYSVGGLAHHDLRLDDVQDLRLEGAAGDDLLAAGGDVTISTTWRGGEGSDRLTVAGSGTPVVADVGAQVVREGSFAPVTASATEIYDLDLGGSALTVIGTADGDAMRVQPTGEFSASVAVDGSLPTVFGTRIGSTFVVDPAGGDDTVAVQGTTASDRFAVGRTTNLAVQVGSLLPARIAGTEDAELNGLGGDDRFDLTGSGGPPTLTVAGGHDSGADSVTVAGTTTDAAISVDDNLGTGQLDSDGPPVGLEEIERVDIEGDGSDTLTVRGSDAPDSLTQDGNIVTVGRTTRVGFSRFPVLALAGGTSDDQLWVSPTTTTGVSALDAVGHSGADGLTVVGTVLSERVRYRPTGTDGGTVAVGAAPQVTFAGIEDTKYDGATTPPSGDTVVVATPDHDGMLSTTPGATFDSGTVRFFDVAGTSSTATPLHYGGIGNGEVRFAPEATTPADHLVVTGQPDDDVVTVSTRPTGSADEAVVTIDQQVPVAVPGVHTLTLQGRDGADTFRVPTDHPVPGRVSPAIEVRAGGPDSGDRLDLTAGNGRLVADLVQSTVGEFGHAAIHHTGLELIALDAAGSDLDLIGGAGPDAVTWQPTGPAAGTVTAPGAPSMQGQSLGSVAIDARDGADEVRVGLRSVPDIVTVTRADTTVVAPDDLQPVSLRPGVDSLTVGTGDGADQVSVMGVGGPDALAVDGGAPTAGGDLLRLISSDAAVSYATEPTSGRLDSVGGTVLFAAIETVDVVGNGTGDLRVNGTDGAETLTIGEGATPRVRVDEAAAVTYAGYPNVALHGHGGDDDVSVGYTALGDISRLSVAGGPGIEDQVTVVDTTGTGRDFEVRPTTATTGTVTAADQATTVALDGTEAVALDGRGGDDRVTVVTPAGAQHLTVSPGTNADAGLVRVGSLLPISFQQTGEGGHLTTVDVDGERRDTVVLHGSTISEVVDLAGATGEVRLAGWIPLLPRSAVDLKLLMGDGDDHVTMSGPLPYRTTTFDGGGPDLGDGLVVQGPTGDVQVDLARTLITGYGAGTSAMTSSAGTIRFPGVADLHTDVGGRQLTHVGTARDDALCFDPMAPRDGRVYIVGAPGGGTSSSVCMPDQRGTNVLHTFVDVSRLLLDPAAGADEVIVNGTTSRDLVSVHAQAPTTEVTVHPEPESGSSFRLPVEVVVATTESLVAAADNGSDSVDVSTYDSFAPLITVHGEGPSTMRIADDLLVRDATGGAHVHDTNSQTKGSGTVTAQYRKGSGALIRVDYVDMENVTLYRDPKADG